MVTLQRIPARIPDADLLEDDITVYATVNRRALRMPQSRVGDISEVDCSSLEINYKQGVTGDCSMGVF